MSQAQTQQTQNAPATRPSRELTVVEKQKKRYETIAALLETPSVKNQIQAAIPRHLTVEKLLSMAMKQFRDNPDLLDCTQASLVSAVMSAAAVGLSLEPFLGQAYLIPFKRSRQAKDGKWDSWKEATFIPGYRGLVRLALNSGEISKVDAHVVYEQDTFRIQFGDDPRLEHVPAIGNRGKAVGAYAVFFHRDGTRSWDYMTKDEIENIRKNFSQQPNGKSWKESWDEMAKKTVLRRRFKMEPVSIEAYRAAELENRALEGRPQAGAFAELDYRPISDEGGSPVLSFEDLTKDLDQKRLAEYLESKARDSNVTVDVLKEHAEAGDDESAAFRTDFQEWVTAQDKAPEKTIKCPDPSTEEFVESYCRTKCAKFQGCPSWEGAQE